MFQPLNMLNAVFFYLLSFSYHNHFNPITVYPIIKLTNILIYLYNSYKLISQNFQKHNSSHEPQK